MLDLFKHLCYNYNVKKERDDIMNKMEILKNAFEQIGYRTELEYDEDDKKYFLEIIDDSDDPNGFYFNQDGEPLINGDRYWYSLDAYYKELDELPDPEEDF